MTITVEVSPGELIDRLSILEIKSARIAAAADREKIRLELGALEAARDQALPRLPELEALAAELKAVNEALWALEDEIRDCERQGAFGPRFIDVARAIYRTNDRRSATKQKINQLFNSALGEVKSYARY
jgi:hypothetical protein